MRDENIGCFTAILLGIAIAFYPLTQVLIDLYTKLKETLPLSDGMALFVVVIAVTSVVVIFLDRPDKPRWQR